MNADKIRGERIAKLVRLKAIQFSKMLHALDGYERLCKSLEVPFPPGARLQRRIADIQFRVLTCGTIADQFCLIQGTRKEIHRLISRIDRQDGFRCEGGIFMELYP